MGRTLAGAPLAFPLQASPDKHRQRRNGFEILGYTGTNGGGKTMCAVFDSLPALAAGRPIVSTCRILDPATGNPHPLWVPLDDFRIMLDLEYCDVILDEVTGVASSRESAGLPAAVLNRMQQLRKGDVTVRWTTPNWKRADTAIREVTKGIVVCHGFMPTQQRSVSDDGMVRTWRPRRMFAWKTYDAKNFDEWSTSKERSPSKAHRLRPVDRQLMWGPGLVARECYDTYEVALTLGVVSDGGMCLDCGGKRRPKQCGCKGDEPVRDASPGMLRWEMVNAARRRPVAAAEDSPVGDLELHPQTGDSSASLLHFPETDDTPAVLVDTSTP